MSNKLPKRLYRETIPGANISNMGCDRLLNELSPEEVAAADFTLPRKASYFQVERGNGSIGIHKITNEIEGASLLPVDTTAVNGSKKLYMGLVNPPRFPLALQKDGSELQSNDPSEPVSKAEFVQAIKDGRTGGQRWEMIGGGVMSFGPPEDGTTFTEEERNLIIRKSASVEGHEEAGIETDPESLTLLGRRDLSVAAEKRILWSFLAEDFTHSGKQHLEDREAGMQFQMFNSEVVEDMIHQNLITEATSIASIYKVLLMKKYRQFAN